MEVNKSSIKYIEWHSAEDLHEDILHCISDLRFIKDEQQFLEDLIKNQTLDLLAGNMYATSKEIIGALSQLRKDLSPLLKRVMAHSNNLQRLLDEDEIPGEIEDYKEIHYALMFEVIAYYSKFKKVKRKIFNLIKQVSKQSKQKRLLQ